MCSFEHERNCGNPAHSGETSDRISWERGFRRLQSESDQTADSDLTQFGRWKIDPAFRHPRGEGPARSGGCRHRLFPHNHEGPGKIDSARGLKPQCSAKSSPLLYAASATHPFGRAERGNGKMPAGPVCFGLLTTCFTLAGHCARHPCGRLDCRPLAAMHTRALPPCICICWRRYPPPPGKTKPPAAGSRWGQRRASGAYSPARTPGYSAASESAQPKGASTSRRSLPVSSQPRDKPSPARA